jgi:hypothetical protein
MVLGILVGIMLTAFGTAIWIYETPPPPVKTFKKVKLLPPAQPKIKVIRVYEA